MGPTTRKILRFPVGGVLVGALLAQAQVARAASVTVREDPGGLSVAVYVAAAGERNDVALVSFERTMRIADAGAVISASGACRAIDAHTAACPGDVFRVRIKVGDLDDRVIPGKEFDTNVTVDGGPGNDVLMGVDRHFAADRLNGGGGQDQLYGRGGPDGLTDGDRDGAGADAAPGPDLLDGGGGYDTLSYARRTEPVRVRAGDSEDAGESGERDSVRGIENVDGGAGDDRLIGDRHGNLLDGGRGDDVLDGRAGGDAVGGGDGDDRLSGGRGSDIVYGGAGIDELTCGGDDDQAYDLQAREVVPRSCEEVRFEWFRESRWWEARSYLTRARPWWLSLVTSCPIVSDAFPVACRGTVDVREPRGRHRLLARGRFAQPSRDAFNFHIPLALTAVGYGWWTGQRGRDTATVTVRIAALDTPDRPFRWSIRRPQRR